MSNKKLTVMKEFKIQAYTKAELAMLYFPDSLTSTTAVKHLMAWIRRNELLKKELQRLGYMKTARLLTPKEVAAIVYYLGEP